MYGVKKLLLIFSLLCIPVSAFCANARISLPALSSNKQVVLPVDCEIGQTVQPNNTVFHSLLTEALSSDFDFEWLEKYVHPDSRASIAEVFSSFLSENLPASSFVMSELSQNGDSSVSISVRFGTTSNDAVAHFVVDGSYIIAMSTKKNL